MKDVTVIENCSTTQTIEITIGQTESQNIALPDGKTIIKPLEKVSIPKEFDCGCGKLFAYVNSKMIFCAIVPLCGETPIKINPELKKVSVLDGDIPLCDDIKVIENFEKEDPETTSIWFWVLILLLIAVLYYILRVKYRWFSR